MPELHMEVHTWGRVPQSSVAAGKPKGERGPPPRVMGWAPPQASGAADVLLAAGRIWSIRAGDPRPGEVPLGCLAGMVADLQTQGHE